VAPWTDTPRRAARWVIPPAWADLAQRLTTPRPTPPTPVDGQLPAANPYRGRHAGERCFILATGPSITGQDLTLLASETCIAVSHFFLHEDVGRIDPAYHVLAPYHPPFDFDTLEKLFDGLGERYSDRVTYFVGHTPYEYSIAEYLKRNPQRRRPNMHFVDYSGSTHLDDYNHGDPAMWDIAGSPFLPRTVIYSAIQVAAYMGFTEIYLLGCDHDYLTDMTRVTNHHFYAEEDGVSDAEHLSGFTTERWFQEYYQRWRQYRLMRDHLASRGVKVYNATAGGMLDVFGRAVYEEVVGAIVCAPNV